MIFCVFLFFCTFFYISLSPHWNFRAIFVSFEFHDPIFSELLEVFFVLNQKLFIARLYSERFSYIVEKKKKLIQWCLLLSYLNEIRWWSLYNEKPLKVRQTVVKVRRVPSSKIPSHYHLRHIHIFAQINIINVCRWLSMTNNLETLAQLTIKFDTDCAWAHDLNEIRKNYKHAFKIKTLCIHSSSSGMLLF